MPIHARTVLKCVLSFFVILALYGVVGCGGGGGGSAAPPLPENVTIKVYCGRGAQGTEPGVYSQKRNSVFNYAFTLTGEYKDLQVRLNGDLTPSSGSPVVAADVTLIATAIPVSEIPRFKTNTHTHTTESLDGHFTPAEMVSQYHDRGYDVLFLTDHNKFTLADSPDGMLVIPGEELTGVTHANALFVTRLIEPGDRKPAVFVKDIIDSGALATVNHPFWAIGWTMPEILSLTGVSLIEIYNTSSELQGYHDNLTLWDSLLSSGKLWYGVASDDAHKQYEIGKGWIMVQADRLDSASIRKGIEDGAFYASTGVELCRLDIVGGIVYIESRNGQTIEFIGKYGRLLFLADGPFGQYPVQDGDEYVRVVVTGKNNIKAWTQPLFWKITP